MCISLSMYSPLIKSTPLARVDVQHYLTFWFVLYIDDNYDHHDARRFAAMHLSGDVQTKCNARHGREHDTAVGAWKNCWWHWATCSTSTLIAISQILTHRIFDVTKRQVIKKAFATLWPTLAVSLRLTSPLFWKLMSPFWVQMIYIKPCKESVLRAWYGLVEAYIL